MPVKALWPEICLSSNSCEELLAGQGAAQWVEWRSDLLGARVHGDLLGEKVLWTWRLAPSEVHTQPDRLHGLLQALDQCGLVDMQLDIDEPLLRSLRCSQASKVVLSYHGPFESLEHIEGLLRRFRQFRHVSKWKLALDCSNTSYSDIIACLELLEKLPQVWRQKIVFIPMGRRHTAWRLMASRQLSPFLFCCSSQEGATAHGQPHAPSMCEFQTLLPPDLLMGLLGSPVNQSVSHVSHNRLLNRLQIQGHYFKFDVDENELRSLLKFAHTCLFRGFSVTTPHKQIAFELATTLTAEAKLSRAVNTLTWQLDGWHGDNTDVKAFQEIFCLWQLKPSFKILILGAGGSSRAALAAASRLGAKIYLINRSQQRSVDLQQEFEIVIVTKQDLTADFLDTIDVLVQTTSVGMQKAQEQDYPFPLKTLPKHVRVVELVNGIAGRQDHVDCFFSTPLVEYARGHGNLLIDAQTFFFKQAAYQFESWLQRSAGSIYPHFEGII